MADSRRDGTVKATGRADVHTPVTVLTGFLGSGKTTLLNRVLKDPASAGFIVVINEFGQVSIDHALTATSSDSIVVLENGCLCCTVFGDLLQTLNRLYHAREAAEISFDRIVIETSGLADLTPVVQAFLSDPTLEGLYRLSAVIATVDAVNAIGTLSEHEVSVRQVALADCILVTKLDLLPVSERAATLAALTSRLRGYNRTARICAADDPGVILSQIICQRAPLPEQGSEAAIAWLDSSLRGQELAHGEPAHHHDSSITSFNLIRTDPVPREALQLLLTSLEKHLGPNLLRVKGLVNVAEQPSQPAVIQGAQHLMHNLTWLDQWPDSDHRTRIVFITQGVPANELEELVSLLDRVAHRTANARLRASATARASTA